MKIISTGNTYRVYADDLKTYDQLPAGVYTANFSKFMGFYLEIYPNIEVKEKVYGPHEAKVKKIMAAFDVTDRNLGVILSGDKGIGKSVCAKMIAESATKAGRAVILVNSYTQGIASFLESIEQELVVIFDEFDKTFRKTDECDPQTELLTLFDGFSTGKKLFVITCNELRNLNDYIVNRPGRFHYHLRFEYPSGEEIKEYLKDKLAPEYFGEINKVVGFAGRVNVNYDCLRAIATEINTGLTFEDAIADLNIMHLDSDIYTGMVYFADGGNAEMGNIDLDLFAEDDHRWWIEYGKYSIQLIWNNGNVTYDHNVGANIILGDHVSLRWDTDDYTEPEEQEYLKNLKVDYIKFKRKTAVNLHYVS